MLRINLLPPYIYDKQKKVKWIVASAGIFAATLGVLLWWYSQEQAALKVANDRNEAANTQKSAYDQKVAAIKAEQDKVAATKAKQTFVSNAIKYNDAWPATYTQMRDITTPKVLLKNMNIADDHMTINLSGFCVYEEDLVRWWMFLRSTQLFSTVHFNLPEHPWPPKASTANTGGSPGSPGGFGSSGGASFGPSSGGGSSYPGGGGGSFGGSPGSFAGSSGSFGGGGGGADSVGEEEIEGRKGIKFTATATLKTPLAGGIGLPVWPPGGGATPAGSGGPGGGGGFPSSGGPSSSGAPGGGGGRGRGGAAGAGRQD